MNRYFESFEVFTNSRGDNFWGDRGAGILPVCKHTKRILLNHRSEEVNEPGTYGVYGGAIHGQNIEQEAKREFIEETGYVGDINLIKAFRFVTPSKSFSYQNFIGIVEEEFEPEYDWESQGHLWVTLEELLEMIRKTPKKIHFGLIALINDKKSLETIRNI